MHKIIFNVTASKKVGLGHIYRSYSLAQSISEYKMIFMCESKNYSIIKNIIKDNYKIIKYTKTNFIKKIKIEKPSLLVNDILNTSVKYMTELQRNGVKTLNFEDLGKGSKIANFVINELYDKPVNNYTNTIWGHKYFFLRDEFKKLKPNNFRTKVKNILITFGGTDQHNLTSKVLRNILDICNEFKIGIHIVTGAGYSRKTELKKLIKKLEKKNMNIFYTHSSGVISLIMSRCDIAITSNGRTVYELAEMNIPSIVISQHSRENTHLFARKKNGFFPIGIYKKNESILNIRKILIALINDLDLRKKQYKRINNINFKDNKIKVLNIISNLINENIK